VSHSSSGPGRWTLNPATRVRRRCEVPGGVFPHATPHLHPRWAAGLRSQLGRFDSSWRYKLIAPRPQRPRAAGPPSLRARHSLRSAPCKRASNLFVVGRSRLSEGCAPGSTPGEEAAGMEPRWLTSFIRSESVGSIPTPATLTTRGGTRVS